MALEVSSESLTGRAFREASIIIEEGLQIIPYFSASPPPLTRIPYPLVGLKFPARSDSFDDSNIGNPQS